MMDRALLEKAKERVSTTNTFTVLGNIEQVVGLTIEGAGLAVNIGELCEIVGKNNLPICLAEVVGFRENRVLLMPLGEIDGIGPGCRVKPLRKTLAVSVGLGLLGRVLNGLGQPIDGKGSFITGRSYQLHNKAPDPLARPRIQEPLGIGVRAIDGFLTCGKGQRLGIFAGSGVGKSTLLGMVARNTSADVNVIALIGERGREVREFIERDLGEEGLRRSVVVVATSEQPPLVRVKGAFVATAIAEYFRDQGKDVLLLMDSITRFAMAQREIGLAIGEPPVTRGFPPSVFALLPRLLERAGQSQDGSITGFYTVLVDGDDMDEPITDAVRGIVDGHIVLSRRLAHANHYPAIDVLASVSRVMNDIVSQEHQHLADKGRRLLAAYREAEDLINIGAYQQGSNPDIDEAIAIHPDLMAFLRQGVSEKVEFEKVVTLLRQVLNGV